MFTSVRFLPLSPTWIINYPVSGDTIGECLKDLPLEPAEIPSGKIASMRHSTTEQALAFRKEYANAPEQQADWVLMESLDILFTFPFSLY